MATVQPDQMQAPTPCEGWDVRALINHMIAGCQGLGGAVASGAFDVTAPPTDLAGSDPAGAYNRAADTTMRELRTPGVLEKVLKTPFGERPAAAMVSIMTADQMIHSWDLARALGQPYTMDEDLASATLKMMQDHYNPEQRRVGKMFAAAVPCADDASVQDRLIALSGRQP
jgi:uncharacterized protein (TIGR03086 family)